MPDSCQDLTDVVTCFVTRGSRVLLLRRSQNVGTYRGRWAGVSGYLEKDRAPREQAEIELKEELGLCACDVRLTCAADPFVVEDRENGRVWRVHPFRYELVGDESRVRLDWEHAEMSWRDPAKMGELCTVPGLASAWHRVCGPRPGP